MSNALIESLRRMIEAPRPGAGTGAYADDFPTEPLHVLIGRTIGPPSPRGARSGTESTIARPDRPAA